jgi:polar amino acid transport system substrate-binding protein
MTAILTKLKMCFFWGFYFIIALIYTPKRSIGMQKGFLLLCLVTVMLLSSLAIGAEENITQIKLMTAEWPGYTNQDGTGLYFDVLKAVYEPVGITIAYELLPWKRAQKLVKEKADALVGENFLPDVEYLYPKWPIDVEELTVIFKKSRVADWQGEASLEHKQVGWIRGYHFDQFFHVKMDFLEIDELRNGLLMLDKDRLDFLIDYEDGLKEEIGRLKDFDVTQYRMEPLRVGEKVYVAFVDSPRGRKLVEIFNIRMTQLFESGELDRLYRSFTQWHYDKYPQ